MKLAVGILAIVLFIGLMVIAARNALQRRQACADACHPHASEFRGRCQCVFDPAVDWEK